MDASSLRALWMNEWMNKWMKRGRKEGKKEGERRGEEKEGRKEEERRWKEGGGKENRREEGKWREWREERRGEGRDRETERLKALMRVWHYGSASYACNWMPPLHIGVSICILAPDFQFSSLLMHPVSQRTIAAVLESLPSGCDTQIVLLAPGFSRPRPCCCNHLGRKQPVEDPFLSSSLCIIIFWIEKQILKTNKSRSHDTSQELCI